MQFAQNEVTIMTRRYPKLTGSVLRRDGIIVKKILDVEKGEVQKVLDIYTKENKNLSDERYWELMRTVWILVGSVGNAPTFIKWMRSTRKQKFYFSTPEEAKYLRELPDIITVYRATNDENDGGISWTISKAYAERYKEQFDRKHIIERTVHRSEVFAYIERNQESEIIILP